MFKGRNELSKDFILSRCLIDRKTGCWNWTAYCQSNGYGQFSFQHKPILAHRVSWWLWNDQAIPKGLCVLHRCDNRRCVNPNHLFLGTHLDNVRDCIAKGRNKEGFCKGHLHSRKKRKRKLTDAQVKEIRATRYREPLTIVAKRYGISMGHVSLLRRGKRKQLVV